MALSQQGAYAVTCARIASLLHISLGAARQWLDRRATREGVRMVAQRLELAQAQLATLQERYGNHGERPPMAQLLDETVTNPNSLTEEEWNHRFPLRELLPPEAPRSTGPLWSGVPSCRPAAGPPWPWMSARITTRAPRTTVSPSRPPRRLRCSPHHRGFSPGLSPRDQGCPGTQAPSFGAVSIP